MAERWDTYTQAQVSKMLGAIAHYAVCGWDLAGTNAGPGPVHNPVILWRRGRDSTRHIQVDLLADVIERAELNRVTA